jgi:hydroxyacylglutathione hydrolase
MSVAIIPALVDNYIYLIRCADNEAIVIDPAEAQPVIEQLEREGRQLVHILLTHHHHDHVGGVKELKERFSCPVWGPRDTRLPDMDRSMQGGESLGIGGLHFDVIASPGHTRSHVALHFPAQRWLFSGDALFLGGCGRLFEGDAEEMWTSLKRLRALPDETLVYCGHEYTESNLRFALSLEPASPSVLDRVKEVQALRQKGKPSIPGSLGQEKRTNPFLRVDDTDFVHALSLRERDPVSVFAKLRSLKDHF